MTVEPALVLSAAGVIVGAVVWLTTEIRRLHVAVTSLTGELHVERQRSKDLDRRVSRLEAAGEKAGAS